MLPDSAFLKGGRGEFHLRQHLEGNRLTYQREVRCLERVDFCVKKAEDRCFTEQRGTGLKCRFLFLVIFCLACSLLITIVSNSGMQQRQTYFSEDHLQQDRN